MAVPWVVSGYVSRDADHRRREVLVQDIILTQILWGQLWTRGCSTSDAKQVYKSEPVRFQIIPVFSLSIAFPQQSNTIKPWGSKQLLRCLDPTLATKKVSPGSPSQRL